ncbi:hypothetical protein B0H19DRAFT_1065477 [Mycena capillaripes]|nr:hypothetical protein B0H19DRAFT_1065477 [Mycena capillaripes]
MFFGSHEGKTSVTNLVPDFRLGFNKVTAQLVWPVTLSEIADTLCSGPSATQACADLQRHRSTQMSVGTLCPPVQTLILSHRRPLDMARGPHAAGKTCLDVLPCRFAIVVASYAVRAFPRLFTFLPLLEPDIKWKERESESGIKDGCFLFSGLGNDVIMGEEIDCHGNVAGM